MIKSVMARAGALLIAMLWGMTGAMAQAEPARPNIVLVLVDDAALMDFGAYGGEAKTPNIDALAKRGTLFTQYRTSPLCAPSRAMLLTGMDNHRAGVATIPGVMPPEQKGKPGYSLVLEPGVATLADYLKTAGYRTLMAGKWHLGSGPGELPTSHGFDHSFALDASGADNWEDKSYIPYYSEAPWYEDGEPADLPENFYSSEFLVDKMISYLDEGEGAAPFFAYLAFQAIHIPVQVSPEYTARYDGVYDQGWQALREQRHRRAIELGLVPQGAPLAPMPDSAREWASLSDADRELYTRRMQANAGMMEAMDFHLGRLIAHLKARGIYDNTLFVVTSDNGPEYNRGDNDATLALWMHFNGYHVGLEGLGEKGSWGFIGPEWANAAASPSDLFKFYAAEGGIRVPFVIAGPGIETGRVGSFAMVSDVAPTVLDLAGVEPSNPDGRPMTGKSLVPVLTGQADHTYGPDEPAGIEVSGNSALFLGRYKITRNMPPVGDGQWRLYDLSTDPGETRDLSADQPQVLDRLLRAYTDYAARMGVLPMPEGYDSAQQLEDNIRDRMVERYGLFLALGAVLIGLALWGMVRLSRRKRAG